MSKLLRYLTAIGLFLRLSVSPVQAVSEFSTTFNSLYTVKADGDTQVTHTITLKNNLAHIYATDYTMATSGEGLTHVVATDESGPLTTTATEQNGVSTIHMTINHPAIGKDQVKTITVSYNTSDVVERIGNTTSINIPRLAKANEAETYTRIVRIEGVQGEKELIYPPPNKIEPDGIYSAYTFLGHQSDSLTLLFGDSVTYKLNLTYELKNKEISAIDSELALPPDTAYQHVQIGSLTPSPRDIRLDHDGNWLARYSLKPQEKLLVTSELYVTVYPQPTLADPSTTTLPKSPHSKYWETSSSTVSDLADKLKTPETMYRYLTDNFTYNYSGAVTGAARKGAVDALTSPTNVLCTEFTDSFVALARAKQIPAREINGYGYTKSTTLRPQNEQTDILHAWPEYYDSNKKAWIAIDPTWGNTTGGVDYFNKLDFSHIVFVRHGAEDSYPLPAGAYKSIPGEKYVHVEIAGTTPDANTDYRVREEGKQLVVENTGNVALVDQPVEIGGETTTIGYLPPYGELKVQKGGEHSLWQRFLTFWDRLASWAHIR